MGLSDKELLKCAFPHPQAEGDAESLGSHGQHLRPPGPDRTGPVSFITSMTSSVYSVLADDLEPDGPNALRYVPGKARSHHLEMMLSKEELEEEQRSVKATLLKLKPQPDRGVTASPVQSRPRPRPRPSALLIPFTLPSRVSRQASV